MWFRFHLAIRYNFNESYHTFLKIYNNHIFIKTNNKYFSLTCFVFGFSEPLNELWNSQYPIRLLPTRDNSTSQSVHILELINKKVKKWWTKKTNIMREKSYHSCGRLYFACLCYGCVFLVVFVVVVFVWAFFVLVPFVVVDMVVFYLVVFVVVGVIIIIIIICLAIENPVNKS